MASGMKVAGGFCEFTDQIRCVFANLQKRTLLKKLLATFRLVIYSIVIGLSSRFGSSTKKGVAAVAMVTLALVDKFVCLTNFGVLFARFEKLKK